MVKNLFLIGVSCLALAACATTETGQPDCTEAPAIRAGLEAGIAAANTIVIVADQLCAESSGPDSDSCKTAKKVRTAQLITIAGSTTALSILNARCPIAGPPGQ